MIKTLKRLFVLNSGNLSCQLWYVIMASRPNSLNNHENSLRILSSNLFNESADVFSTTVKQFQTKQQNPQSVSSLNN